MIQTTTLGILESGRARWEIRRSVSRSWLAALAAAAALAGCTVSPTPPSKTPVYEDDTVAGVEPLSVEKVSVDAPEASEVDPAPSKNSDSEIDAMPVGAGGAP